MPPTEAEFLQQINAELPDGVDWKQGAVTYLRELVVDGGEQAEWFHLTKPFLGGPDFSPFWVDVFYFLDVVHRMDLGQNSRVLDVGCGPGWTVQWLAKLGHEVIGLDISQELLDIAERRMQTDPYPPYFGRPFRYDLRTHDIEAEPLGLERPVDLALFESTLHHFYDPVSALRNVARDLAPDGALAVIEAAAPPVGSEWHTQNTELMARYHTIERPYTREQLLDMLELAGYGWCEFYRPVNGLFSQDADGLAGLTFELARASNINIFIASPTREGIERLRPGTRRLAERRGSWEFVEGFHQVEARPDGTTFRWAGPRASVRIGGAGTHTLRVSAMGLHGRDCQTVFVVVEGTVVGRAALRADRPSVDLAVAAGAGQLIELQSDRVFSPCWTGATDPRVLSFTVDAPVESSSTSEA